VRRAAAGPITPGRPVLEHRYSDRRRERAAAVQEASRQAAYLVQLGNPAEVAVRNRSLAENPEAPIARFDSVWSYDVEQTLTE